jgi:hypothetical protein
MSKIQSKDFLNISCIVEDSTAYNAGFELGERTGRGEGFKAFLRRVDPVLKKHQKTASVGAGLGTLVSGGIGYYLGKNNEDTHSLYDKIVNTLNHHHES